MRPNRAADDAGRLVAGDEVRAQGQDASAVAEDLVKPDRRGLIPMVVEERQRLQRGVLVDGVGEDQQRLAAQHIAIEIQVLEHTSGRTPPAAAPNGDHTFAHVPR